MSRPGESGQQADAFEHEMNTGRTLATQGRWRESYRHFEAAHDLGHGVRSQHLAAHRAALHAATATRHPGRILYQTVFLAFAWLTASPA